MTRELHPNTRPVTSGLWLPSGAPVPRALYSSKPAGVQVPVRPAPDCPVHTQRAEPEATAAAYPLDPRSKRPAAIEPLVEDYKWGTPKVGVACVKDGPEPAGCRVDQRICEVELQGEAVVGRFERDTLIDRGYSSRL